MTRARDRDRRFWRSPVRPTMFVRGLGLAVLVVVIVAACDVTTVSPTGSGVTPSGPATGSPGPGSSDTPSPSVPTEPTAPSGAPNASAVPSASPSPSGGPIGSAAACSGLPKNRDFFAAAAAVLDWNVYCGVLPDAWFVEAGNYRLRDGGQLYVAYRGPNGARLELREGAFCGDSGGCVPSGQEAGQSAFGDRQGTLVILEGGGYAVVVDRAAPTSWLAIGANLDEETFRVLIAQLHLVSE